MILLYLKHDTIESCTILYYKEDPVYIYIYRRSCTKLDAVGSVFHELNQKEHYYINTGTRMEMYCNEETSVFAAINFSMLLEASYSTYVPD